MLIVLIIGLTVIFGSISTRVHHLLSKAPETFRTLIFFTDSFTVPFFISLILFCINNYWWKGKFFKWLINLPNLNGRYVGKLYSSYLEDGQPKIMDCAIEIKQTSSDINIFGYFGDFSNSTVSSSSISTSETIIKKKNGFFRLYYVFTNETDGLPEKLNDHTGTGKFEYYPDLKQLKGEYYNKNKNTGTIVVVFKEKKLISRLLM